LISFEEPLFRCNGHITTGESDIVTAYISMPYAGTVDELDGF
jgi:hypothetical protein